MIRSMTAFARHDHTAVWGALTWEIRAVNHRYLDISFRLPDILKDLETVYREKVRTCCQRGKLEISLRYQPQQKAVTDLSLNQNLVKQLTQACVNLQAQLSVNSYVEVGQLLQWPGMVQTVEIDSAFLREASVGSLEQALHSLTQVREQEGQALLTFLNQRLAQLMEELAIIEQHLPTLLIMQREKLLNRFQELQLQLEPQRLEQEMILHAQRLDVSEEIARLAEHFQELARVFTKNEAVGRRLDFLIQELNREVNTVSSKINDMSITRSVVEMKVLIEQMREQVQNIE